MQALLDGTGGGRCHSPHLSGITCLPGMALLKFGERVRQHNMYSTLFPHMNACYQREGTAGVQLWVVVWKLCATHALLPAAYRNVFGMGVADGVYMWKELGIDSGTMARTLMETCQHMVAAGCEDVYKSRFPPAYRCLQASCCP